MNEDEISRQLRQLRAEATVMDSLVQALLVAHENPTLVRGAFEIAHNRVMAGPLFEARTDEGLLDKIAEVHGHALMAIEYAIEIRQKAAAGRTC